MTLASFIAKLDHQARDVVSQLAHRLARHVVAVVQPQDTQAAAAMEPLQLSICVWERVGGE